MTFIGGQDYQVTITGLGNPSLTGPCGPFALRTRFTTSSQQVDVNLAFGSVFIYTAATPLAGLSVTLAGTTVNNVINKGGNTLSFKFTLGVSLWRYDTFIINTDYRWTVAAGATCASADYTGKWNNFNGTNSATPHALDCVLSPQSTTTPVSQNIYIYGLAVDGIDLTATSDNAFVDLRVTSVMTPNAVYTGNPYSWTVSTSRFGTTTVLETATISTGPTVTWDTIITYAWTPTWGAPAAYAPGTTYFMDLSFTIVNPVPAGGTISIAVSGGTLTTDTNWGVTGSYPCYIVLPIGSYTQTCTAAAGAITLAKLPVLLTGAQVKVRNLVLLPGSGTASITSIYTYDSNSNTIDQTPTTIASAGIITVASTGATATSYFNTIFATNAGVSPTFNPTSPAGANLAGGSNLQTQSVVFAVQVTGTPFIASTTVAISCPFSNDVQDFTIGVATAAYGFAFSNTATVAVGSLLPLPASLTVVGAAAFPPTLSAGTTSSLGSISFNGSIGQASATTNGLTTAQINLQLYASSTTSFISLPRIANNLATVYECRVLISTTASGTTTAFYGVNRFLIAAQTWFAYALSSPCMSYSNGIPAIFAMQPNVVGIPPSSPTAATYYVEFQFTSFTANFNAGTTTTPVTDATTASFLASGSSTPYPVQASVSSSVSTPSGANYYVTSSTTNYVAVSGLTVSTSAATTVTFPIGGYSGAYPFTITPTVISYYVLTSDPRYKFITHSTGVGTQPTFTYSAALGTAGLSTAVVTGNSSTNGSAVSAAYQLGIYNVGTGTFNFQSTYSIFFLLGQGYTWSTSKTAQYFVGVTPNTFSVVYYFSSPTAAFSYPGTLISLVNPQNPYYYGFSISTTAVTIPTIALNGFSLPLGVPTPAATPIKIGLGGAGFTCIGATIAATFTSTVGSITPVTVTASTDKASGPDGVAVSHTVTFSLPHGVPAGGSISLTISSSWTNPGTACTTCSVSGLASGSTTTGGVTTITPVKCVIAASVVTVTQFADTTASAPTSISIVIYGLIAPATASVTPYPFVTALSSATSGNALIDQALSTYLSATTTTSNQVTVSASSATGSTTWTSKRTYPSNAGSTSVDLYLKFALTHSLPACGVITISSPMLFLYTTTTNIKNLAFFTLQYTNVAMSSTSLAITLGQGYTGMSTLELYLDFAVTNPSSTTATSNGFSITTTWGGIVVDQDSSSGASAQAYSATAVLGTTITAVNTAAGPIFLPTTTGEAATYTFDFKDTSNYALGDQYWIVFPSQFDYFLGNTWVWFTNEPSSYYIECSSSQLGTTWCAVNHNIVVVWGSNAITGNTEIVININNVINPAPTQTSNFQIYHVGSTGNFLTVNQIYGTVTPTGYPVNNVYVRSLVQSDARLFQSSQYTWRLYFSDTIYTDSQLQVQFPREFDLNKFDTKSSYSCSSTWLDNSASATIKTQQSWNTASSCSASGNLISFPSPTTQITFTITSIVTWTIQSIINNQWGQPRYAQNSYTDFDVTDSAMWPLYPYWVSKFTFFVYRSSTSNLFYSSRSYPNTNAAYAGFYDGYRPLFVNNYTPQTKLNRIIVYAGTQTSDIYIATAGATSPISAKQITLTPTTNPKTPDNGKLKYTSATSNWILFQAYWQIQFRVAAAIDLIKGLYYINWANNELKQTGLTDVQYDPPVSTLVEVIALTKNQFTFVVASVPNISTGYTSVPIKVSIVNAPHADATVNISVSGSPANISVNPTSLTFGPDVNALYFQVSVASNYDLNLGTSQSLSFTVTGSDAAVYTVTPSLKFTITQTSTTIAAGNVVSWGLGTATKTIETATPSTDQVGVIYYQLSAAGAGVPNFASLKVSVGSLISTNSTSTSTTSSTVPTSTTQSDPASGETWTQFQYRLYKLHLGQVWVGALSMITTAASTTLTFNWLYAATQYQLSGYLDNLSPSTTPTVHTEYFTTAAIADAQPFTLTFSGNVALSFSSKIAQDTASIQGVNPLRLGNATYTQSTSRILATSTVTSTSFQYVLVPNRFSENPSPVAQAQITGTSLTALQSKLQTDGITYTLNTVTSNAIPTRTAPTWTTVPVTGGATTNTITVTLRTNTAGQVCCVALSSSAVQPTPEQVMLGLDPTNAAANNACTPSDLTKTTNSVQITGLQAATNYFAFCTATDNYPLWPTQMSYSSTITMSYVAITTLASGTTTVVTSASYFGGLLLLIALLLH